MPQRNPEREAQILNTPVQDLMQEMVVREFINKMADPTITELQRFNLQMELQRFVRGDASLLAQADDPAIAEQINQMRAKRAAIDEAEQKFSKDPLKFVDEVITDAEKKASRRPGDQDQRRVVAAQKYQTLRQQMVAERKYQELQLAKMIATGPKRLVHIDPEYETVSTQNGPLMQEIPVMVSTMGKHYQLKTGDQMVPEILARIYEQKRRTRQEQHERENALDFSRNREKTEVDQDMIQIDRKYGSKMNILQ
jgi:hypothetical protein